MSSYQVTTEQVTKDPPSTTTTSIPQTYSTTTIKLPTLTNIISSNHMSQRTNFNRFILNNHQKKSIIDKELLDQISQRKPEKTVACQRCRRLRKKCSKHTPQCLTCAKMGEDCQYVDKLPTKRKRKSFQEDDIAKDHIDEKNVAGHTSTTIDSNNTPLNHTLTLLPPLTPNAPNAPWQYDSSKQDHIDQQQRRKESVNVDGGNNTIENENYTYQDALHPGTRSMSIPSINVQQSSSIILPSLSFKQDQDHTTTLASTRSSSSSSQDSSSNITTTSHKKRNNTFHNNNNNIPSTKRTKLNQIQIQNALLSTLINLGKQNLIPTTDDDSNPPLMIQKDQALKYIKSYFDQFYKNYPFIHKGQFYKHFENVNLFNVLNPNFQTTPLNQLKQNFQIYLILNIGFKNLQNSNSLSKKELQSNGIIFNNDNIQKKIQQTLTFNTVEDIKILTLLVIDSYFARNCLSTTNLTNLLTGLTLRYNLHRKLINKRSQQFSRFEIEMRIRLFWTVYSIDRTTAVYLNKLIAIPDEFINLPYPIRLEDYDSLNDSIDEFKLIVELKQIEGQIYKEVHSVLAINSNKTSDNDGILKNLRNRIESWFLKTTSLSYNYGGGGGGDNNNNNGNPDRDNSASIWFTTRYYNCLTVLYRHSYLNPSLSNDILDKLSKAVLQNLSYSYNLTMNKSSFSINWLSFFRILIIFKTLLKCLVSGSIKLNESKTELNLCIELLKNYVNENEDWKFIQEIIDIFQKLLKLSFIESITDEEIHKILINSEISLTTVLKINSVGCKLDDRIEDEYDLEERIKDEYNYRK